MLKTNNTVIEVTSKKNKLKVNYQHYMRYNKRLRNLKVAL